MKHLKLSFLILGLLLSSQVMGQTLVDGIYYTFSGTEATVVAGGTKYTGSVEIPATVTYNETTYNVTSIGDEAFFSCTNLTSVIISEGVRTIGGFTFYECINLSSVSLPSTLDSIAPFAFLNCKGLTSLVIPEGVRVIDEYAFISCSGLISINLPGTLEYIARTACKGCDKLTTIQCGGEWIVDEYGIVYYDNQIFMVLPGITSCVIPNTITTIPAEAFSGCSQLVSIVIPEGVTTIGEYAFSDCSRLTSITLPNTLESIDSYAFMYCSALTSIVIPEGVRTIGEYAFSGCSKLTSIMLPNTLDSIAPAAFSYCSALTSIVIPEGVRIIDEYTFQNCSKLTSVTLPSTLEYIDETTFEGCNKLTSIQGGGEWLFVDEYGILYYNNQSVILLVPSGITSCVISDSVTSIPAGAFRNRTQLTSVVIPGCVTYIGDEAFAGCTRLQRLEVWNPIPPECSESAFQGTPKSGVLHMPAGGSIWDYAEAPVWKDFTSVADDLILPDPVTVIDNAASSFSINVNGSRVSIQGDIASKPVTVYAVNGRIIYSHTAYGDEVTVLLPAGVYIICIDSTVKKVIVK